jgi:hypothetical protein
MIHVDTIYYNEAKKDGRADKLPKECVLVLGNFSEKFPKWQDGDEYHGCMFGQKRIGTDILGDFRGRVKLVSCNLHNVKKDDRMECDDCMEFQSDVVDVPTAQKSVAESAISLAGKDATLAAIGKDYAKQYFGLTEVIKAVK